MSKHYVALRNELQHRFTQRDKDWRYGGIVYQVFVDRFSPSAKLTSKKALYAEPRKLKSWITPPKRGVKDDRSAPYWSHELDFWGGDIASLTEKLPYIKSAGASTLYLNPIFEAYSNHKYDTYDYEKISPEYGTMDDFKSLVEEAKKLGLKLILDGVFNHMSSQAPKFIEALKNTQSVHRDWFVFGKEYASGYRLWHNVASLPELNLQNPKVREYLFNGPTSIVKRYIKLGVDGWRLDTAIELGYDYLEELTNAAHDAKKDSVVVGELNNYPSGWSPAMDGVMLFPLRELIIEGVQGNISAHQLHRMIARMVHDTGIETMLKSWILLENHDTIRVATALKKFEEYKLAKVLQFSLPGTINLYMGEEFGMTGADDPENRAAMDWSLNQPNNPFLMLHKQLIGIREKERALRIGDFDALESENLIAFFRKTDLIKDCVLVIVNPSDKAVSETLLLSDGKIKSHMRWINILDPRVETKAHGTLLKLNVPAKTAWILKPDLSVVNGYSAYKNIFE